MNELLAYIAVGFFIGIHRTVEMIGYNYRTNALEVMVVSIFWPLYWLARLQQKIALLILKNRQ